MLKFTYTETGLYVERLSESLEELISRRILLALRFGHRLIVEPGTATILLPAKSSYWAFLNSLVQESQTDSIAFCGCDADWIEVSLQGTWIAQDSNSEEGIFLAELDGCLPVGARVEWTLLRLWEESACASAR